MALSLEDGNPFRPPEPARKRVVNISVTKPQMDAIDRLQDECGLESRAAVLKLALAELIDRHNTEGVRP